MSKDLKKQKALDALLDSATFTEAAEKAGISRKTLYSYIRTDADFAIAYRDAQERITLEHVDAITASRAQARDTILSLMNDPAQPGTIRLKAAQIILDKADSAADKAQAIAVKDVDANTGLKSLFGL